jgi:cysteinyl-tRNA synthetase
VPGLPEGQYLGFFGQYVLNPVILEYLAEQIAGGMRERGEYQLTTALDRLRRAAQEWGPPGSPDADAMDRFAAQVNDDLNMPRAMAVVQEVLKSQLADAEKLATILSFDRVLGLDLDRVDQAEALPADVQELVEARRAARASKEWAASDRLRDAIQALGYTVQDTPAGMQVIKNG